LYVRLGMSYRITDYLFIGANLKTAILPRTIEKKPVSVPFTGIEYVDFRIGYSF
jgi:hypothetical protein